MTDPKRRPNPADRKRAVAERARRKAQENLARSSGGSYLKWTGKVFEAKNGMTTLWSVLPYIVKERHHPDGVEPGELWYKRPYVVHANQGPERNKKVVCPTTFNPRAACVIHEQVAEWKKDYDVNKASIDNDKGKNRDLFLVYDHDAKEIFLVDEPHGGGNMIGFGMLLDSRITNPRQEDWAAFWLDGDDGMALEIQWRGSGDGGKRDWIKPISIDFIERKKAPVPKEIWGKAVELSELLIKTTSEEIEKMYLDLPEEECECSTPEEEPTDEPEQDEEPQDDEPEPEPEGEEDFQEPDWFSMNKQELLAFAKEPPLSMETKTIRQLGSKPEKTIRTELKKAWEAWKTEDLPSEAEGDEESSEEGSCPFGYKFGVDFNEKDKCTKCKDEVYETCMKAFDDSQK